MMRDTGADTTALSERADSARRKGQTAILVAVNGRAAGLVAVADRIKETTPKAIAALHDEGLRIAC